MNKLILGISIFLLVASFSGCQSGYDATGNNSDLVSRTVRRIGTIQSLGGSYSSNQATGILKQIDGSTILLRSSSINFNDQKYRDKSLELTGVITNTTDQKEIMDVNSIDILEKDQSVILEVPNWVDFNSSELAFGFRYRDDYQIDESAGEVLMSRVLKNALGVEDASVSAVSATEKLPTSVIKFKKLSGYQGFADYLGVDINNSEQLLSKGYNKSKIGSEYYNALKQVVSSSSQILYLIENKGLIEITFEITNPVVDENYSTEQNYFFDVLSSLKLGAAVSTPTTAESDVTESPAAIADITSETVDPSSLVSTTTTETTTEETIAVTDLNGYSQMDSSTFNFSLYYPKTFYFSYISNNGDKRVYQFGTEPIETVPGEISLELLSGALPTGNNLEINGKQVISATEDGNQIYYFKGDSGRLYKVSGPSGKDQILKTMISTVEEK